MSDIPAEENEGVPSFFADGVRVVATLVSTHFWLTFNIALAAHPALALVYMFFPPLAAMYVADQAARFPEFSLWLAGVYLLSLSTLYLFFWRRLPELPAIRYFVGLPFVIIWLPVASGEVVRAIGMHSGIVVAGAECYETSSFIASLHDRGEYAQAHAWMVKDGKRYIWSYSELRFIPDSRPFENGGRCR